MNDLLKYSLKNLWKRKLRSFLTVLSILIGITAIFTLVSFGQGIQKYMDDFAKEMGTDKIIIQPKGGIQGVGTTVKFNENDVDFLKKINGISGVAGMQFRNGKVEYKAYKPVYTFIMGFPIEPKEYALVEEFMAGIEIEKGRNLKSGDALKAVLGYNYMFDNKLFKKRINVGDSIKINGVEVNVIGFYEQIGNPSDDSQVYLTFDGYRKIFNDDSLQYIVMRTAVGEDPGKLSEVVKEKFRKHRGLKEGQEDFTVQTFEDALATFTNIINIINAILVLIALVSIFVASVNIANTMYTSIIERTQEIGVMKAVGAKNSTILWIFVIESGILGMIGGIIGVILGYFIASIGGYVAAAYGLALLKPHFPLWLTIGCLLFAFLVGAISGYFPAKRASKMKPVEALRWE